MARRHCVTQIIQISHADITTAYKHILVLQALLYADMEFKAEMWTIKHQLYHSARQKFPVKHEYTLTRGEGMSKGYSLNSWKQKKWKEGNI